MSRHRGPGPPNSTPLSAGACMAILLIGLFIEYWWLILIILILYIFILALFNS